MNCVCSYWLKVGVDVDFEIDFFFELDILVSGLIKFYEGIVSFWGKVSIGFGRIWFILEMKSECWWYFEWLVIGEKIGVVYCYIDEYIIDVDVGIIVFIELGVF